MWPLLTEISLSFSCLGFLYSASFNNLLQCVGSDPSFGLGQKSKSRRPISLSLQFHKVETLWQQTFHWTRFSVPATAQVTAAWSSRWGRSFALPSVTCQVPSGSFLFKCLLLSASVSVVGEMGTDPFIFALSFDEKKSVFFD